MSILTVDELEIIDKLEHDIIDANNSNITKVLERERQIANFINGNDRLTREQKKTRSVSL